MLLFFRRLSDSLILITGAPTPASFYTRRCQCRQMKIVSQKSGQREIALVSIENLYPKKKVTIM